MDWRSGERPEFYPQFSSENPMLRRRTHESRDNGVKQKHASALHIVHNSG
jgi:hypothetical protein